MPRIPKPPNSGRKKGTPNTSSLMAKQIAEQLGVDPFEILLYFVKGDWESLGYTSATVTHVNKKTGEAYEVERITPDIRAGCAKEACRYIHPQRKAIEGSITADVGVAVTQEQVDLFRELIKRKAERKR